MKPSPALQAARDIKAMCFIDQDQGRGDETRTWATLDEDLAAEHIQEALEAQHRKTWALAINTYKDKLADWEGEYFANDIAKECPCPPIEATKDK